MNKDLRFKIARMSAGHTQQTLAEAAGCRESLVARIESGRARPDPATAERIANALRKRPIEIGI